jgi:hypothetical protein
MKDASRYLSGGSCFEPRPGSICLQPLVAAISGVQDPAHVHESAQMLLYCDVMDFGCGPLPLVRPLRTHKRIPLHTASISIGRRDQHCVYTGGNTPHTIGGLWCSEQWVKHEPG